jgi:hypothetical protein
MNAQLLEFFLHILVIAAALPVVPLDAFALVDTGEKPVALCNPPTVVFIITHLLYDIVTGLTNGRAT